MCLQGGEIQLGSGKIHPVPLASDRVQLTPTELRSDERLHLTVHNLALFKALLGEPFLGILIFFFSSFCCFPSCFSFGGGETGT